MLDDQLKQLIEKHFTDHQRFLWVVDPLEIAPSRLPLLFPNLSIHTYSNPVDFRLFYEPLREKMEKEEAEPADAIVISKSEKDIPPDVKRYSLNPLVLKPSSLFPSLHPIIDDILIDKKLVERFAPSYDGIPRDKESAIRFVLHILLDAPIPANPSIGDAFKILHSYHLRGKGIPPHFIQSYLAPLKEPGFQAEELMRSEDFLQLVRQLLLIWIEEKSKIKLDKYGIEERARKIFPDVSLEPRLTQEVWELVDWEKIASEVPIESIPSLISPLLPEEFYSYTSKKVIEFLSRDRRNISALKAGEKLRKGNKASDELKSLLDVLEFLNSLSIPREDEPEAPRKWMEIGRKVAFQQRNIIKVFPSSSDIYKSSLRREWETKLDVINSNFVQFVLHNYPSWIKGKPRPTLSCDILSEAVFPYLKRDLTVYLLVIDGMTYAQWALMEDAIKAELSEYDFQDRGCFSVLPSTTIYSRNAIFAGALPRDIVKKYGYGVLSSNQEEEKMLRDWLLEKVGRGKRAIYCKDRQWEKALDEKADLKAFILRFTDEITHLTGRVAETEEELLALVETAYRYRPFSKLFAQVKKDKAVLIITSDHGSIWVERTERITKEEHTEAEGRSNRFYQLSEKPARDVNDALCLSEIEASDWGLPRGHYLIAHGYFMFQAKPSRGKMAVHGGISLWEMCVPLVIFTPSTLR